MPTGHLSSCGGELVEGHGVGAGHRAAERQVARDHLRPGHLVHRRLDLEGVRASEMKMCIECFGISFAPRQRCTNPFPKLPLFWFLNIEREK